MWSHLLVCCFSLCSLTVSYGAPVEHKVKGEEDLEEADLYKLNPTIGQFLDRSINLEDHQGEVSLEKELLNSKNSHEEDNEEDVEEEEEDSVNGLLQTVLLTLRDHPDIIMAILQDEERKNMDFRYPPEQLEPEPKRAVKKDCDLHNARGYSNEASDSSGESEENSESRDGDYYKNKYDKSSKSSEGSEELNFAQYYQQKYGQGQANYKTESSSSEEDDGKTLSSASVDKRVPEQPEETIDITSLPDENDVDLTNMIAEGGLEDLPEYKELKENSPKSNEGSLNVGHDTSGTLHTSSRLNAKNTQQKHSALKPVVTEAQMSQGNEDSRESLGENHVTENTENENSKEN